MPGVIGRVGTLLGEFGAEVIKIERPGRGDVLRQFGPVVGGESLYWLTNSRNKKSVVLDLASEAGRGVLGDLRAIVRARRLSRATLRNIRQNLFFAFVYNTLGIPIAAGALYPLLGVLLSPMLAAAAMSLSSVSVISNALRLRGVDL